MMILVHALMIELKKRDDGAFELSGKPETLGYTNVIEWLSDRGLLNDDNSLCINDDCLYEVIEDAKIHDMYEYTANFSREETRFNGQSEHSAVVVRKKDDSTFWLMLDVNLPEALIFKQVGVNLDIF